MSLKITHKYSTAAGTPPAAGDIDVGELAINAADAKLFTKDTDGAVQEFISQFEQAGIGAISRSIESKLQDVVSVKDFGAVGDGVTDDTAAIQAAIDKAADTISMPPGTYLVSSSITVKANCRLVGSGISLTTITADGSGPPFNAVLMRAGASLENLRVDLNGLANSTGIFIDGASGANKVTVSKVCVIGCGFHGIAATNGTSYNRIIDCETSNCGHRGVILSNTFGNFVSNLYSHSNNLAGFLIYNGRYNLIDGLLVESISNASVWVHMESYSNILRNVVIRDQVNPEDASLYLGGNAHNNIFSDFAISGSNRGILVRGSSVDAGLTDGDTRNNQFTNFRIIGNGAGVIPSAGVRFESFSGGYKATRNRFSNIVFSEIENGFGWTGTGAADTESNYISDCQAVTNVTHPWRLATTEPGAGNNRISNFAGYTPTGSLALDPAAPAVPATNVPVVNPYPYTVMVNIAGLTGQYQINGVNSGLPSGLMNYTLILAPGQTITLVYSSGAPTWRWWGI